MNLTVTSSEREKNNVKLCFTVGAAEFDEALEKAYKKEVGKYNIPGFRKGKAPRYMIERMYGEGVFYNEAIEIIFPEAYDQAVAEAKIEPVARPEVDIGEKIGKGVGVDFVCDVTVKPEVKLGKYKGLKAEAKEVKISDADIDAEISKAADKNARVINIEDRAAEQGDIANIDFKGMLDGVAFEGGTAEKVDLTLGSGQFIPGFEEQIVGHSIGEEFSINVKFPENYGKEELNGKDVVFEIRLNALKVRKLPEIDDEFASDVSVFDTLDEYKADIKKNLEAAAEKRAKNELESSLIETAVADAEMDIPEVMYENQLSNMISDMDMRLRYQGLDLKTYMQYTGMTYEALKDMYMPEAKKAVAARLLLEQIAVEEHINISDEEFEAEMAKIAAEIQKDVEEYKKNILPEGIANIKEDMKIEKAVKLIVENAKIAKSAEKTEKKAEKKTTKTKNAEAAEDSEK